MDVANNHLHKLPIQRPTENSILQFLVQTENDFIAAKIQ